MNPTQILGPGLCLCAVPLAHSSVAYRFCFATGSSGEVCELCSALEPGVTCLLHKQCAAAAPFDEETCIIVHFDNSSHCCSLLHALLLSTWSASSGAIQHTQWNPRLVSKSQNMHESNVPIALRSYRAAPQHAHVLAMMLPDGRTLSPNRTVFARRLCRLWPMVPVRCDYASVNVNPSRFLPPVDSRTT